MDERQHLKYSSLRVVAALRGVDYSDRDEFTQEIEVNVNSYHFKEDVEKY